MTMSTSSLNGLGVAMVTPFHADGRIDYPALQSLTEHLVTGGADFLVVLGTTAETPTLSTEEQRRVVDFVLEVNSGRLPVVMGMTGNNTAALCERLRSWDFEGITALLSAAPAYNKPSQAGLIRHFEEVADSSPVPLVLYNVPGRTSCNMTAETTLELARHANICGVKEASGDMAQISKIIVEKQEGFSLWSGDDALAMSTVALGAEGLISVLGNAYPRQMSAMIQQIAFGQINEARTTHVMFSNLISLLFEEGNPTGIKCVLNHLGLGNDMVRLPLLPGTSRLKQLLYEAIAALDVPTT